MIFLKTQTYHGVSRKVQKANMSVARFICLKDDF